MWQTCWYPDWDMFDCIQILTKRYGMIRKKWKRKGSKNSQLYFSNRTVSILICCLTQVILGMCIFHCRMKYKFVIYVMSLYESPFTNTAFYYICKSPDSKDFVKILGNTIYLKKDLAVYLIYKCVEYSHRIRFRSLKTHLKKNYYLKW